MTGVEYEFPPAEKRAEWQELVNTAIANKDLRWMHELEDEWVLAGKCPRCGDQMSNVFDLHVYGARMLDASEMDQTGGATIHEQVVCNCSAEHASHPKDVPGCGWGKELEIEMSNPEK
jgi:hypothetical protein